MEIIDNVNKTLKEDLTTEIHKGSKVSIAAACFSIYAFAELKKELKNVDELRFIFTSPTFIKEKAKREKREFYIPRQEREKNLFGSEFEVKLRNEMTQKAIAKECAEWIRKKAVFKSNVTNENMMGFINVDDKNYMPLSGFTTVDLGCERGNNAYYIVQKSEAPMSTAYLQLFEQIWNDASKLQEVTDEVIENITTVYNENSPDYLYFVTLYNIFNEFLEDVSDDVLPNEATGFKESKIWGMLYNFQKDAALAIINKLEKYNGCILADSVGLGKTFTALSVMRNITDNSAMRIAQDNMNVMKSRALQMSPKINAAIASANNNAFKSIGKLAIKSSLHNYQFDIPAIKILDDLGKNATANLISGLNTLVNNSAMREIQSITSRLGKWLQTIDFSPLTSILENIRAAGFDHDYREVNDVFLKAMFDAKWFPYAGWIASFRIVHEMLEILNSSRASKNRIKRIDRLIFSYYDKDEIDNFKRRWRKMGLPSYMIRILVQAVQAYHRREYALTVSALSTLQNIFLCIPRLTRKHKCIM